MATTTHTHHKIFRGDSLRTLLSEADLRGGVRQLADEIRDHYGEQPITIIAVLTGAVVLLADLIRLLDMPLRIGFVRASSYRGQSTSSGHLVVDVKMLPDIRNKEVLLLDDIFDTGRTLLNLLHEMDHLNPATIRSAALLRKQGQQQVAIEPDHVAFEIPNEFVVGYGLDYNDLYRNLPYLAALDPADLTLHSTQEHSA